MLYAACRPDQTAADARFDEPLQRSLHLPVPQGARCGLRRRPARQLHSTITKGLKSEDFEQRSTLEGPAKAKKVAFGQLW